MSTRSSDDKIEKQWTVATLVDVARFFNVAHDTVRAWRRNGMPGRNGAWDLSECVAWRDQRRERTSHQQVVDEKKLAETRRAKAQADAIERRNRQADGELIDRRITETQLALLWLETRRTSHQLPQHLRRSLPNQYKEQITAEVDQIIRTALADVADRLRMLYPVALEIVETLQEADRLDSWPADLNTWLGA